MQYHKTLGITQGIAMTVTTFVGTGLMVVPAMSVTPSRFLCFLCMVTYRDCGSAGSLCLCPTW